MRPKFEHAQYEAIADAFKRAYNYHKNENYQDYGRLALRIFVNILEAKFEADNPRFDLIRFEKACGLQE